MDCIVLYYTIISCSAAPPDNGHLHIDADKDDKKQIRGMYIINNCKYPIKPLSDILTVFKSSKGGASDAIGENGVGVKQGCATLSDLSFVLSRNKADFGFGVVALDLQKTTGIYLPSFTFKWNPEVYALKDCIQYELKKICTDNPDVAGVITKYGQGKLEKGIGGLIQHFIRISTGLWGSSGMDYVFGLVIHNLKHASVSGEEEKDDDVDDDVDVDESRRRAELRRNAHPDLAPTRGFLTQLVEELPKHYLHVAHSFDVNICGHRVSFSYWQRRLVEMTHFHVVVDKRQAVNVHQLAQYARNAVSHHNDNHGIDVYIGFDAMHCAEKGKGAKPARLVYHSRRAGRLIKQHRDARNELGLNSSGSLYCQGLTIVVDDKHGALPLNPTKQGACIDNNVIFIAIWLNVLPRYLPCSLRFCLWRTKTW